mmetsp:Transcript_40627/g.107654  ORF Transcript_40627/g.107654 Transcript_40627/m.107654 type:complete len:126 (-) Transcript_40627:155-532(-)
MPTGTMLRWNSEKGFGFLAPSGGGEDVFCHVSGLLDGEGSVREGDRVTFKISYDDRKGKDRAVDVCLEGGSRRRSLSRDGGGSRRRRDDSRGRDRSRNRRDDRRGERDRRDRRDDRSDRDYDRRR